MNEQEALKYMTLFRNEWDVNSKTKNAEAIDVTIKSLKKQIPKKPLDYCCPNCQGLLYIDDTRHCPDCGQALDWSDTE